MKIVKNLKIKLHTFIFLLCFVLSLIGQASAQVTVNVLAVNNTTEQQKKEIRELLPPELTAEDILDAGPFKVSYDVNQEAYYVHGTITLEPKESKTIKVSVRDVWTVEQTDIDDVKEQVNNSVERLVNTEYEEVSTIRKDNLLNRLDYILSKQEENSDNIAKRIDTYRIYEKELEEIRKNSVSVSYWRSKPPDPENSEIFTYTIDINNDSDVKEREAEEKHFLPAEVLPEHIVETQGHDIRYDPEKGQSYLIKKEILAPGERKKYRVEIIDIWNIPQGELENYKERTRKTYKLLENTEYANSAKFLVDSIVENVQKIEDSQAIDRPIAEHISAYRVNVKLQEKIEEDIEALEALLNAVREKLERSRLKNVLQKIKALKSIRSISESVFGTKPTAKNTLMIIVGVMIFVGVLTLIHFLIWGKRSGEKPKEEEKEEQKQEA